MRLPVLLVVVIVAGCAEPAPAGEVATTLPEAATRAALRHAPEDERCARDTFVTFLTAINKGNRSLLTPMLDGSFMWLTMDGSTTYDRRDAVERLLGVSRSREQWEFRQFEVNGRGWHGGIDFGFVIRRTGADVPSSRRDAAGKGVIDCPDGRIRLFGLGEVSPDVGHSPSLS